MKGKALWLLALLLLGCTPKSGGPGSDEVNNGGNPSLRVFFHKAKAKTPSVLMSVKRPDFAEEDSPALVDWWLQHLHEVAAEIDGSPIKWTHLPQERCGSTLAGALSWPISLSERVCEKVVHSVESASQVLAHESIHHLGIVDEHQVELRVDLFFRRFGHRLHQEEPGVLDPSRDGDVICIPQRGIGKKMVIEFFNGVARARVYTLPGNEFLARLRCTESSHRSDAWLTCEGRTPRGDYHATVRYVPLAGHDLAWIACPGEEVDVADCSR